MSFSVNLTFRGLCALIPSEPLRFDGEQKISDLTVLIPDARRELQRGSLIICSHDPKITFDQPNGPDVTWSLDGDQIELDLGDAPPAGIAIEESMIDVPYMALAAPGSGRVRPDLLQRLAADDLLVAALSLSSGTLQGIEPSPIPLDFRSSLHTPGTYKRRFARAARALILVPGDEIVLRATPVQKGPQREAVLRPKPGRSGVDVTISNLCEEREGLHPLDVDADFLLYYDLLESYGGPFPLPTPVPGQDQQERGRDEVRGEATRPFGCVDVLIDR